VLPEPVFSLLTGSSGDLPYGPGGPRFRSGNNGVGGFVSRINRSGQVAYDAAFFIPTGAGAPPNGGVTAANDSTAWIHTPGAGTRSSLNSQFYQESLNVPATVDAATGAITSNGSATFTGSIATNSRSFSNAGVVWIGTTTGGDTTANVNDRVLNISTAAGGMSPVLSTPPQARSSPAMGGSLQAGRALSA